MPKQDYIAPGDAAFAAQLITFRNAVGPYATTLGLSPGQVADQAADADYFAYTLAGAGVTQGAAWQWSAWKNLIREGGSPPPSGAPAAPVLPASVPPVAAGVEARFRALARYVKASPAYNEALGRVLGIEGNGSSAPDLDAIAPEITATLSGGHVQIGWGWQGHGNVLDMIEILVNRGAGYVPLAFDTTPGYTDTTPLPAAPVKWTYKAIYRKGDRQTGQWSPEVSLTVGG